MSFPTIPNQTPTISLSLASSIPLLLDSIAFEELALAHLINAEAEKTQLVLGTLTPTRVSLSPRVISISNLLDINSSVRRTLEDVIKKEMLLQFKFENVLDLLQIVPISGIISPPVGCGCMATRQNGSGFSINRGAGSGNTTVTFNTVIQNPPGAVTYGGLICQNCTSTNLFTFDYGGSSTPSVVNAFHFAATTFNVPNCPNGTVTITGTGTINSPQLGPNVTYTLILNDIGPGSISLQIVGTNTFQASVSPVGGGNLVLTNCP